VKSSVDRDLLAREVWGEAIEEAAMLVEEEARRGERSNAALHSALLVLSEDIRDLRPPSREKDGKGCEWTGCSRLDTEGDPKHWLLTFFRLRSSRARDPSRGLSAALTFMARPHNLRTGRARAV
jgi:hypothetical protein